ncbi:hypothetical protein JK636_17145 [Clostridium sp. YIM B02515]|uniref:Tubulin like n=1 Tax=Clostridium rhizosphaerae TaxID=2803861 RepID=A0ABS1TDR8_9CLOT|nr:tubulin-like doman-containing protein [Clostridium rhizosphaerae]MBL4937450.1 hypothetical protein [Clostridium rhizosphaerae]
MKNTKVPKDILPTLIIGLGGTGYQVIKRLKQLFDKRYKDEKLPVRYLLIDTDLKSFLDDSIKNNEKCQLRFGEGIKNTLEWAYGNSNFEWLPKNPKITPDFFTSTDQGAGLVRPIGRMYLCKNAKLSYDSLQTAKNDLVDLHKVLIDLEDNYLENIDRHKVYIVGSLAGGTGCGTFLDVAVMVSKIFNRDNTNIIGMFTLESCYDDKLSSDLDAQNRSKANCYAALKELEFYMSSITNPEDKKYTFKYNNVGEIKLDRKLLDICYLIENKNEMGGVLTNIEDIYDLCSLQLFQEIGTKLGSQLRADYANFICKDKDPVLNRDRHFSTFSSSSMEFSADNLKGYCCNMLAKDILNKISSEFSKDEEALNKELNSLIKGIDERLKIKEAGEDFISGCELPAVIYYKDLKEAYKSNLDMLENSERDKKEFWKRIKTSSKGDIDKIVNNFVNDLVIERGIKFTIELLDRLNTRFMKDMSSNNSYSSVDRSYVEGEINGIASNKKTYGKVLSGKEPVPFEIINNFNDYAQQLYSGVRNLIYKDRYNFIEDIIKEVIKKLSNLNNNILYMLNDINNNLNKINNQNEKKYGGNIISREMIGREFYESYYNKYFKGVSKGIIDPILIEGNSEELIKLCEAQYERVAPYNDIMKILEENAETKGMSFESYVTEELDITSKLAKPFWSAIKNPEVSWTECYYIGCVKDESINNGFTIKAPKEIDNWIRNQTGERSRWARYVETTNPNAIDVIHITMGACAAYLPDIKHYKQFYLKLLASKAYPLHLNEEYIGLEELDLDMEKVLLNYSLARAYGAIMEIDNGLYLNIKKEKDAYWYIYPYKYCLKPIDYVMENGGIPSTTSETLLKLKIGDNYHEAIKYLSENAEASELIDGFIKNVKSKLNKEQLKAHCIENYIKDKALGDFIAKEKINQRIIEG